MNQPLGVPSLSADIWGVVPKLGGVLWGVRELMVEGLLKCHRSTSIDRSELVHKSFPPQTVSIQLNSAGPLDWSEGNTRCLAAVFSV